MVPPSLKAMIVAAAAFPLGEISDIWGIERFQAKWKPVRVKKTRQIRNLEPRFDSIETEKALVEFLRATGELPCGLRLSAPAVSEVDSARR
jgi:hypothetical protein